MTATDTDLTAADVAWNLEPLVEDHGVAGVDDHLREAARLAGEIEQARGTIATLDAAGLAELMGLVGDLQEHLGRAGSYAGLRFTVDTADPERGALMQRIDEESTAIATRVIFLELEWAAVPDEQADGLLADDRLAFCAHYLRSARRYRPHLLTEPEEKILAEKDVTGASAWSRLFSELTSAIAVELDGESVPLEQGLSRLSSPDRSVRAAAAAAVTEGLAPGLRTRAFVFNTLLADKSTDDRLRSYGSWVASRNLANEASDESVQALVEAVVHRYDIPQRWYALKAQLLGVDRLADYDRMASVAESEVEFGWDEARGLVMDAYASFSPELASIAEQVLRRVLDRRADAPGEAAGRVLRLHRAVAPPVPAAQLDVEPPGRAHARARDGARPARLPVARAGRVPHEHAAHARGDRVGVRRDGHVRPAPRRDPRSRRAARAARREPRRSDRDGVPPDRDEPVRGRGAHAPARGR